MFIPLLGQQHTSSPKNPQKALPHAMAPAFVLQQDIIFPHLIHDMVDLYSYNCLTITYYVGVCFFWWFLTIWLHVIF